MKPATKWVLGFSGLGIALYAALRAYQSAHTSAPQVMVDPVPTGPVMMPPILPPHIPIRYTPNGGFTPVNSGGSQPAPDYSPGPIRF